LSPNDEEHGPENDALGTPNVVGSESPEDDLEATTPTSTLVSADSPDLLGSLLNPILNPILSPLLAPQVTGPPTLVSADRSDGMAMDLAQPELGTTENAGQSSPGGFGRQDVPPVLVALPDAISVPNNVPSAGSSELPAEQFWGSLDSTVQGQLLGLANALAAAVSSTPILTPQIPTATDAAGDEGVTSVPDPSSASPQDTYNVVGSLMGLLDPDTQGRVLSVLGGLAPSAQTGAAREMASPFNVDASTSDTDPAPNGDASTDSGPVDADSQFSTQTDLATVLTSLAANSNDETYCAIGTALDAGSIDWIKQL
jgi:hypothetical protein